jgi:hypothetical protein
VSQPQLIFRKTVVLIGLLLILVSTVSSQNKQKHWLRGAWLGTGYQTDDNTTWAMKLTVKKLKNGRRAFSIDYPSLDCGGRWKSLGMSQSKATFRELLDHGQDKCSDKGLVTIERIGRQLVFLYSNEGSREITASAVLNRTSPGSQ